MSDMEAIMDSTATQYTIKLDGGGLQLNRTIDESTAMRVMNVVMGVRGRPDLSGEPDQPPNVELTVGEFVEEVGAKRNPDKITAFGVYLKRFRDQDSFTRDELRPMFEEAGEPPPGNFGRDLRWAVNSKWIATSNNGKSYFVTSKGEGAVDGHFAADLIKATRQTGKRRMRKPTKS